MTKKFYYLSLLVGLVCGMCFTSCCDTDDVTPIVPGGGGGEEVTLYLDNEALPAGIIDPTTGTIQLTEGGELTLPFVVEPAELASKIVLSSADPSIVEVNGMKLIAKKPGKTTIYATAGNYTMQYDVEVKEKEKDVQIADTYLAWKADQLVETEIPEGAIVVTPSMVSTGANLVCSSAATFVIEGEVTLGTITLKADINLIIKDGAKLTANKIIGNSNNLSIFGQAQMTGELVVDNSDDDAITSIKTLEVHSAKVTATSSYDDRGGLCYIGTINVYGGSVDAECTSSKGYGIWLSTDGSMNIYGGEVKAVGKGNGSYSYGITAGSSSTVTVYGGKLWAESADKKALNNINLTTGAGYTGTIRYSSDKTMWGTAANPDAKYVKVEKSQGGGS